MKEFDAVIFDFDYTLADSSRGAVECINYGLSMLGLPIPPIKEAKETIGLSLEETFLRLVGGHHLDKATSFSRYFIKRANEVMIDLTTIFEDVPNIIKVLKNNEILLGIVSTKFRYRIESILQRENLIEFFNVIVGGENVLKHKPDPEGLLLAIDILKSTHLNTLYIGDSTTDAETAKRAGIPFVPVLSGVTHRNSFKDFEVYSILNNLSELPNLIGL